tara:strand:- start:4377 stop:4502 length:126 start_codon:yes stop_codon:yes gene_type:complete
MSLKIGETGTLINQLKLGGFMNYINIEKSNSTRRYMIWIIQ